MDNTFTETVDSKSETTRTNTKPASLYTEYTLLISETRVGCRTLLAPL